VLPRKAARRGIARPAAPGERSQGTAWQCAIRCYRRKVDMLPAREDKTGVAAQRAGGDDMSSRGSDEGDRRLCSLQVLL